MAIILFIVSAVFWVRNKKNGSKVRIAKDFRVAGVPEADRKSIVPGGSQGSNVVDSSTVSSNGTNHLVADSATLNNTDSKERHKENRAQALSIVREGEKIWANGRASAPSARFDPTVVNKLLGLYEGSFSYTAPIGGRLRNFGISLSLLSSSGSALENELKIKEVNKKVTKIAFNTEVLGTDRESSSLNVVWYNKDQKEELMISYFAFVIDPGAFVDSSQKTLPLLGLVENQEWKPIGSLILKRTKQY